ncbi:MAG: membrane integrity-associated transporter subunit PqiC [Bilophila wadsworthia]
MKKRAPSLLLALLALAGLLTAGGCSLGRSPRPDFYMLSSPVENVVQSGKEKISGPRVAIGPVSIPGYLDRPQLFLRDGNDVKVELAEFNHWSEPFGEGVTRVLCDAVSASLTPRKGLASPMRSQQPFQWRIAVDIARFDGAPNGSVILDAGWILVNESGEELKSGRFVQHAPAGPDIPLDGTGQSPSRPVRRGSWADDPRVMWEGPFSERSLPTPLLSPSKDF